MCLIVFSYLVHSGYRLVLAANRDEFLDRPTAPLEFNYPGEQILAGRDRRGGGTWLALGADGRFVAITNYRDPRRVRVDPPSRGEIALAYLRSQLSPKAFLIELVAKAGEYDGFNLLVGDQQELWYFSNISGEKHHLTPGVYGLSNHLLDTPWPKVERAKGMLEKVLAESRDVVVDALYEILADRFCPPDHLLPHTGVGMEWERRLAPICITSPEYGTRSSTVLLLSERDEAWMAERSYRHRPRFGPVVECIFRLDGSGRFHRCPPGLVMGKPG